MDWGPTGAVLTVVFGIIAVVCTIVVALRWSNRRRPAWGYQTNKVIGIGSGSPPELKVTFGGEPVAEVFRTVVIFCNNGREPIRSKEDVIRPIVVSFGDAKILREPIVYPSNPDIEFDARRDGGCVNINFKYLDHQDGALIEVFHTWFGPPDCQGKIMGAKEISYEGNPVDYDLTLIGKIGAALFIPLLICTIALGLLTWHYHWHSDFVTAMAIGPLSASLVLSGVSFVTLMLSRRYPNWGKVRNLSEECLSVVAKGRE